MNLETLPGVGPQLAAKIRATFKSDAAFFAATERQDLQAISAVDGITERRAVDLVLAARGDAGPDRFLATPSARKVADRIMERLLRYASTDVGRNRLRLLRPLPTEESARTHIQSVMDAKKAVEGLDHQRVRAALKRLRPAGPVTPKMSPGLIIIAESDAVHDQLHSMGLGRWAALGSARDLQDAASYDVVVVAYDEGTLDADMIPNAVEIPLSSGAGALCPITVLHRMIAERGVIEACANLADLFGHESVAAEALLLLDQQHESTQSPTQIHEAVQSVKAQLDADLANQITHCSLSGPELLSAISSGKLPRDLDQIMTNILENGRQMLQQQTGLRFQPFVAGFPLQVDDEEVQEVLDGLASDAHVERFHKEQKLAAKLARLESDLWDEVRGWLDYDATFALGRFAVEHDLQPPQFGPSLSFQDSIHLDLAPSPRAQRIGYRLGEEHPVAVLTGANSGGKSTLLEHLTQLVVMARFGLPVVGNDVQVPWLDEIHLVTARRGMDAGAFETFLRGFLPVTTGDAKRLVLADEVEAVTELNAAGRILAWVLDRLSKTDSLAVVVTHLADEVLRHVKSTNVRVDGIEATGLDEHHQLVVNRCPVMGRSARSTPELIIQRLAATTKGAEQELYVQLLAAFESPA